MEKIDEAMQRQFQLSDEAAKRLLARHNFRDELHALESGYIVNHNLDTETGIGKVELSKIVDTEPVPKVEFVVV